MGSRFKANFYIVELTIFTCTQSPYHQHFLLIFSICPSLFRHRCRYRHQHRRLQSFPSPFPSALINTFLSLSGFHYVCTCVTFVFFVLYQFNASSFILFLIFFLGKLKRQVYNTHTLLKELKNARIHFILAAHNFDWMQKSRYIHTRHMCDDIDFIVMGILLLLSSLSNQT